MSMMLKQRPATGRAAVASPQLALVTVPLRPSPHRRQARQPHVCFSAQNEEQQQAQGAQQQPSQPQTTPISSLPDSSSVAEPNGMYSVMAALAAAGALETSYLTATKLLNAIAACPTNGCDSVLNSAFGSLFGLPLPLYGAATYSAVALAAGLAAARVAGQRPVPGWLSTGLATGVAVLATTSAALMAILHTQLGGAPCVWCYASAGLSGALLVALVAGMDRRRMADAAGPGLGGTAAAAAALYLGFGSSLTGNAAELELTYANPVVTTQSSEQAVSLAHRLAEAGAKMYGAFWCTHCYDQKQEFGAQAMAEFPYVECFPEGWKKGVKIAPACEAASIKAFPTWVINGSVTEGQLDLNALEALLAPEGSSGSSEAAAVAAAAQ